MKRNELSLWRIPGNLLRSLDMFGAPLPAFNIRGEEIVKTLPGGCLSVVMLSITLLFGLLKLQHLLERKNPEIVTNEVAFEPDDEEAKLDADDPEYMMAFAITNGILRTPKNDPRYVSFVLEHGLRDEYGNYSAKKYPMVRCTNDDWSRFYPIESKSSNAVKRLREQEAFLCFDRSVKIPTLWGNW